MDKTRFRKRSPRQPPSRPPTIYHQFEALRDRRGGTAASRVPLLIWQDVISGPERQITNHHHDFCSLYVVRKGRGNHVIDGMSYAISRGDVYAMAPGMFHYFEDCESLITDTLHFLPSIFDGEALQALSETEGFHSLFVTDPLAGGVPDPVPSREPQAQRWLHLTPTQYITVQAALAELSAEWQEGTLLGALLTQGLFLRLLAQLSRFHAENAGQGMSLDKGAVSPPAHAGAHESTVASAIRFMEEHYREPLRVEQVAASVFLSPDRFTEVFARGMGRTPRDYLRHLRVEQAKMLLSTTDLPIARIAEASGFGEAAYFTRVVRSVTGMTPSAFRYESQREKITKP